ncbi:MAG: DNA-binding response regulator [Ignavibacteriales bacterium]|jgi:DNA-binding NarL/FixJ family response regulator|nr:response regulator transcription factor [Melioribacteraceae bacterium]RJP56352.1 MAG: DNA-binding response regulator [Ignavibacteriales bacterium]
MKALVADDHSIVRMGVKHILERHPVITTIFEASDGQEALKIIEENELDLVILDISMPLISGLEVLKRGLEIKPGINFLILSMHAEKEYALRVLKNGASGYLTKDSLADDLHSAIDIVLDGKKYVSQNMSEILLHINEEKFEIPLHEKLSEREFDVLIKLASGKKLNDIAQDLFLSVKTVSTYKTRLLEKMNLSSVAEITKYAIDHKLIE